MTRTDPLMAMLRQLAHAKTAPRGAPQTATGARDAKDPKAKVEDGKVRADHFREQLRVVAQGVKHEPQPDATGADMEKAQDPEPFQRPAMRPRERTRQPATENAAHRATAETASTAPADWHADEAALSSVMSKLEQAQAFDRPDDDVSSRAARPEGRSDHRAALAGPPETPKMAKTDAASGPNFAASLGAVETRTAPVVKVVVRDQETHFQPVGQPTLLQKIVDRIAPDLATTSAPPTASPAEAALTQPHRGPDAPVRMLTLQLDPPDLGLVTVRMRLTGDAVEVKLTADRQDTTQLLRSERGALVDAMQSAGYTFEIASIDHSRAGHMDPGAGQSQAQSNHQQSQQPQGGTQFSSGTPERQPNDAHAGTRHNRQGHDQTIEPTERRQDEEVAPRRTGDGVYL